ncbi:MAG: hypothetical protein ACR2JH_11500 [Solirubrobacteraceae bacterium]
MSRPRLRSLARPQQALLAVLALWALVPAVAMIVHALRFGERLTGADGIVGGDQLQYLAWIRDAGSHVLANNLFSLPPSAHAYVQPMFTLSGLLWWIGLPLQAAYWLWKPVAIAVLFTGAAWWTSRMLHERGARAAALTLALFLFSPIASLVGWALIGSPSARDHLLQLSAEIFPAGELWGYMPAALAVGLMPVAVLTAERALQASDRKVRRRLLGAAGSCALLIAWLHPWQGLTLILILLALAAWAGSADWRPLMIPALAAVMPLTYYLLLSKLDPAWELASRNELVPRPPLTALVLALVPMLPFALAGLRRPGRDLSERALLLWIPACLITYFAVGSFSTHALESLSLPIAVLCVRGAQRIRLPLVAGALMLAAVTVPGLAYEARAFRDVERSPIQQYYENASDSRALDWVANGAPAGGVLARTIVAVGIPSQTGRAVWVGHQFWSRDYPARSAIANAMFAGTLDRTRASLLVRLSGVRLVFADCGSRIDLRRSLAPVLASVRRFGCASVGVIRGTAQR